MTITISRFGFEILLKLLADNYILNWSDPYLCGETEIIDIKKLMK